MGQNTQINGNRYSFVDITVSSGGVQLPKGVLQSINYSGGQDPGLVQGNQVTPVGRTRGYGTSQGDFEMLVSELDDFLALITQNGTFPITAIDFNFEIAYSVNDVDTRIDTLIGCRITNVSSPNTKGNGETVKTCQLSIMRQKLNGIDLYADPA